MYPQLPRKQFCGLPSWKVSWLFFLTSPVRFLQPHPLLSLSLSSDRASEWTPLWTVNWCRWTLQILGRWKPLLKSCWEPALPAPPRQTRRTPSSKPWRTPNGSCRWTNTQTTLFLYFTMNHIYSSTQSQSLKSVWERPSSQLLLLILCIRFT